ncbi:hypothetical protein EG832_17540 [bacterium]|nr:hypothetical protein [bacterium]
MKINRDEIKRMLDEGIEQKTIAEHFNVSPSRICVIAREFKKQALPDSLKKLTDKEIEFAMEVAKGATPTDAAQKAFDCSVRTSAKTLGSRLTKEPDIKVAIADLMAQQGITRRHRIDRLADLINSNDLGAVSRGLDMSFRLDSLYGQTIDININHQDMSEELEKITNKMRDLGIFAIDVTPDSGKEE